MTELGAIFLELGLSQYLETFVEQGFDTWDIILDITESDFDALGVKLGHRRKLQRKIANSRGLSIDHALLSPRRQTPSEDRQSEEGRDLIKSDVKDGGPLSGKRKYRRHPKADEHAPERPPSAYVIFSNKMREDLKGRNLTFTEIAKLVGEHWQNLSTAEKDPFEAQAAGAKDKYNSELVVYKKTENYKKYAEYLVDFKIKQNNLQQATELAKRPKLENQQSNESSGTASSVTSHYGSEQSSLLSHVRVGSMGGPWFGQSSEVYSTQTSTQQGNGPSSVSNHAVFTGNHGLGSPPGSAQTGLPGYRDIVVGHGHPSLTWRDNNRETNATPTSQMTRHATEQRTGSSGTPQSPHTHQIDSRSSFFAPDYCHPPPLKTESSNMTNGSSASGSSSILYGPRTPLEPQFDRSLPLPAMFPVKSASYDQQLPPLRPPSHSPQTTINPAYHNPPIIAPLESVQNDVRREYPQVTQSQPMKQNFTNGPYHITSQHEGGDEEPLDPVSALLRADELVNRTSRS